VNPGLWNAGARLPHRSSLLFRPMRLGPTGPGLVPTLLSWKLVFEIESGWRWWSVLVLASAMPISVAAAPPGAADAKSSMTIGEGAYPNSDAVAVAVISKIYAGSCGTVPTPTSVVGVNATILIPRISQGTVCMIGRSRIPVVGGGEGGSTIICRTITIISVAAGTLRLAHACRQQARSSDCCRV
jgi:hypothetical protein